MFRRWLIAAVAGTVLLAGCTSGASPTMTPSPEPSDTPTATETPAASETPAPATSRALVYFLIEGGTAPYLVREPRDVTAATPAKGALEAMIAGPLDPDYSSPWPAGTKVLGISHNDHVIKVDLSGEATEANVGSQYEILMVQQLIWTVTEALEPGASVQILIEGEPARDAWGHEDWNEPVGRADPLNLLWQVLIDSLGEGDTVTSPFTVTGEAALFEATGEWRLSGDTDQGGTLHSEQGQQFSPWSLEFDLAPGTYTLTIAEIDMSDGASGQPPQEDSRTFTVVES